MFYYIVILYKQYLNIISDNLLFKMQLSYIYRDHNIYSFLFKIM